jgi:hypothetical protein
LAPVAGKLTYDIRAAETEELIKDNGGVRHLIFLYITFLAGSTLTPSDTRKNLKDGIEEVWNKVLKIRPNGL